MFHTLSETADSLGADCYVIGGHVRDILLERDKKKHDIDVMVVGSGIEMAKAYAKRLGKGAYLSVFKTYGTAQVKHKGIEVEFVGARKESYNTDSRNPIVEVGTLQDDLNRRDFTVNAMALCLNKDRFGELVDIFNGQEALKLKLLRTPLDPDITFSDDPLRMMRAVRFAAQLDFTIDPDTFAAIVRNKERIKIIKTERITDEINKIMLSDKPSIGLILMEQSGLLEYVFPELDRLKGVEKRGNRAHKDVFLHTLKVLDNVASKSDNLWLRWAALLHDIGKPATKQWDKHAGWTFRNHNFIGSKMVNGIFRNLKLPLGEPMRFVKKLVDLHMRPIVLSEDEVTDSAVRRLLFDAGDDIDALMALCESDITSANREKVKRFSDNFQLVRVKLKEIEEKDRIRNFKIPIDGIEIMELFSIPPCNIIGELKETIKDAILDGQIPNDRDAAYNLLLKIAAERGLQPKKD